MVEHPMASPVATGALIGLASTRDYALAIDPGRRFLQLTVVGVWGRATSKAFAHEVATAVVQLQRAGVAHGTIRTLIDASTSQVMPQESVGVLQELTLRYGPASERIAILLNGMLQKLQVQRAISQGMLATFFDRDEALAWLLAD